MTIKVGDLWKEVGVADLVLFTANCVLNSRGELIMGAGAALEAKTKFPKLPMSLGMLLQQHPTPKKYGVLICNRYRIGPLHIPQGKDGTSLGAFQTKEHWRDNSRLDLIQYAVEQVKLLVPRYPRIAINFPGVNHGRLREEDVLPLLESLPDNVVIYKKG